MSAAAPRIPTTALLASAFVVAERPEGTVVFASSALEDVFGLRPGEALGRTMADVLGVEPPDVGETLAADVVRADGSAFTVLVEADRVDIAHRELLVLAVLSAFPRESAGAGRADTAERERLAEALRRTEDRLRRGEAAARMGYWEWPFGEGAPAGVWWSDHLFELAGRPRTRGGGLRRASIRALHPDDRRWVHSAVQDALEAEEPFSLECRILRGSGEVRHVELAGEPRDGALHGVVLDVTEHRFLAEELRQAQKLHAVGRLTGGVAHDFNNVLTSIMGYVDLLLEDGSLSEEARSDVNAVAGAVSRAAELTGQLLTFSRKQGLSPTTMDVTRALGVMHRMLDRLMPERIRLTAELADEPTLARIDGTQLEQIILNLAANARDAIADEGVIHLSTRVERLDADAPELEPGMRPGSYVAIGVSDTGSGMDGDALARCFDPFFTTKSEGKGTGLGLASVKEIVARSGGSVRVSSAPGEGTAFTIRLPRTEGREGTAAAEEDAPRGAGERILVVDDDQGVRELARRTLEGVGYTVSMAHDGAQAIEAIERGETLPHLLISDVVMPVMGGPDLVRRLRSGGRDVPVLFITGHAEAELSRADLPEHRELLRKPFGARALARAVARALEASVRG